MTRKGKKRLCPGWLGLSGKFPLGERAKINGPYRLSPKIALCRPLRLSAYGVPSYEMHASAKTRVPTSRRLSPTLKRSPASRPPLRNSSIVMYPCSYLQLCASPKHSGGATCHVRGTLAKGGVCVLGTSRTPGWRREKKETEALPV